MQVDSVDRVRPDGAELAGRMIRAEYRDAVQREEGLICRAAANVQSVRRFRIDLHAAAGERLEEVRLRQPGVGPNIVVRQAPRPDPANKVASSARAARPVRYVDAGFNGLQRYRLRQQRDVHLDRTAGRNEDVECT